MITNIHNVPEKIIIAALTLVVSASALLPSNADPNDYSCDPAGRVFLLLPHHTDCTKFYMCTHGREVEFSCPPTTIFAFHIQTCQWPSLTKCILRRKETEEEGSGDEVDENMIGRFLDPVEQHAVDSIASVRPMAAEGTNFNGVINCNRADEAAKHVAYKGDCQRYWRCVGGIAQAAYCSDGLFFNEATQQCDFEANSKCDPSLPEDELQSEFIVYKK
ncbi:unnamed protein product [Arctia plantaginis]|uniref:Chitin-binding type-2 domain-containing protein n=1 Tax=Arctia plantaginis TaxID=874455 RepID=A0A8S1BUB6_ARCPL|nr:unnamed protein product [Arctia plantaginis]